MFIWQCYHKHWVSPPSPGPCARWVISLGLIRFLGIFWELGVIFEMCPLIQLLSVPSLPGEWSRLLQSDSRGTDSFRGTKMKIKTAGWLFVAGLHFRQLPCCNRLIYTLCWAGLKSGKETSSTPLAAEPFSPAGGTCEVVGTALAHRRPGWPPGRFGVLADPRRAVDTCHPSLRSLFSRRQWS